MSAADDLADLGQTESGVERVRTVTAVNSDGTVDIDFGPDENGAPVLIAVACMSGYHTRAPGDRVLLRRTEVGWVVDGAFRAPPLIVSAFKIINPEGTNDA